MQKPIRNKSLMSYATPNKVEVETKFWSTIELDGKSVTDVETLMITKVDRSSGERRQSALECRRSSYLSPK